MTTSPRMIAESGLERVAAPATGDVRSEVFERFRVLVVAGVTVGCAGGRGRQQVGDVAVAGDVA